MVAFLLFCGIITSFTAAPYSDSPRRQRAASPSIQQVGNSDNLVRPSRKTLPSNAESDYALYRAILGANLCGWLHQGTGADPVSRRRNTRKPIMRRVAIILGVLVAGCGCGFALNPLPRHQPVRAHRMSRRGRVLQGQHLCDAPDTRW